MSSMQHNISQARVKQINEIVLNILVPLFHVNHILNN